jgi:hypothetical protein
MECGQQMWVKDVWMCRYVHSNWMRVCVRRGGWSVSVCGGWQAAPFPGGQGPGFIPPYIPPHHSSPQTDSIPGKRKKRYLLQDIHPTLFSISGYTSTAQIWIFCTRTSFFLFFLRSEIWAKVLHGGGNHFLNLAAKIFVKINTQTIKK